MQTRPTLVLGSAAAAILAIGCSTAKTSPPAPVTQAPTRPTQQPAPTIPGDRDRVFASMGNYIFSTRTLLRELQDDAANEGSTHDFGRDILPSLVTRSEVYAYNFESNRIPGEPSAAMAYWRDVDAPTRMENASKSPPIARCTSSRCTTTTAASRPI